MWADIFIVFIIIVQHILILVIHSIMSKDFPKGLLLEEDFPPIISYYPNKKKKTQVDFTSKLIFTVNRGENDWLILETIYRFTTPVIICLKPKY